MRSPLAERLGTELPQIVYEPPDVASRETANDTIELANRYEICDGGRLSPSQELRLLNGMALRSDGVWAAKRVGDFGGRQGAGKSQTVIGRILGGMFLVGETLQIYTAHEFPTANEIFLRIGAIFEAWDDLSRLVLHERKAHGDQGYELKGPPGSEITGKRRLLFKTRTGGSIRGFAKADLLVYDEAQHLKREHIAGSGPAKLANPYSQSWWSGSGGLEISEPAWEMRLQAITGKNAGRLSYTEHTAETWEITPDGKVVFAAPDPEDRDGWYRANCGLGRWVSEEDMADLALELGELFPRECLCIWTPLPSSVELPPKLDQERWNDTAVTTHHDVTPGDCTLAYDVHQGWTTISIQTGSLASSWGAVVDHFKGTARLPERMAYFAAKYKPTAIGLDKGNGESFGELGAIVEHFEAEDLSTDAIKPVTPEAYKAACQAIVSAVEHGTAQRPKLAGIDQLQIAGEKATERIVGGGFVFDRKSSVPLSPLVSWLIARSLLAEEKPRSKALNTRSSLRARSSSL